MNDHNVETKGFARVPGPLLKAIYAEITRKTETRFKDYRK
jgi:hypothetical protein